jgi:anaerobic selenocysteine-containing dehydrogenase
MYAANNCVHHTPLPENMRFMRNWNGPYMKWAVDMGLRRWDHPLVIQVYSEVMQEFRLAAQGKRPGRQPPQHLRERIAHHFDPLPFWEAPLEAQATDLAAYPLTAITQRPMAMYHSWDSQNAWLRQIHSHNYLFVNPGTAGGAGIPDGGWMWVESPWGKVRCMARYSEAVEPGTVWTWNAIGKQPGAWRLDAGSEEGRLGFLLNHLITDELPDRHPGEGRGPISNSDPITGQAGWYDVRVRIRPAAVDEPAETFPQFGTMPASPGTGATPRWLQYFGRGKS